MSTFFSARFFRNRFGNLLNAAKKCTQIEPAAGEKFSNFSARFFRNRFGNLLNAAKKNVLKWSPPQAENFENLRVDFRDFEGN